MKEVIEPERKRIAEEEEKASHVRLEAQQIKIECENAYQKAKPILDAAESALDTLKPADINEMKVLRKPPSGVKIVMHAVCALYGYPVVLTGTETDAKARVPNWWVTA